MLQPGQGQSEKQQKLNVHLARLTMLSLSRVDQRYAKHFMRDAA